MVQTAFLPTDAAMFALSLFNCGSKFVSSHTFLGSDNTLEGQNRTKQILFVKEMGMVRNSVTGSVSFLHVEKLIFILSMSVYDPQYSFACDGLNPRMLTTVSQWSSCGPDITVLSLQLTWCLCSPNLFAHLLSTRTFSIPALIVNEPWAWCILMNKYPFFMNFL